MRLRLVRLWVMAQIALSYSITALACNPYFSIFHFDISKQQFIPTDYYKYRNRALGLSEQQFNRILDQVETFYAPIFVQLGGSMKLEREWQDAQVNARARRLDNVWRLIFYGGYARHPLATEDAMMFLACHETGHHLAGVPFYELDDYLWASAEGQADYFASLSCMRFMLQDRDNERFLKNKQIPSELKQACMQAFDEKEEQLVCIRSALAGYEMTQIWDNGAGKFSFATPDTRIVERTSYQHPRSQCRIDTYLNGAICNEPSQAFLDKSDPLYGTCNQVTGHVRGWRPACWYRP